MIKKQEIARVFASSEKKPLKRARATARTVLS